MLFEVPMSVVPGCDTRNNTQKTGKAARAAIQPERLQIGRQPLARASHADRQDTGQREDRANRTGAA